MLSTVKSKRFYRIAAVLCRRSLSDPLKTLFRSRKSYRVADEVRQRFLTTKNTKNPKNPKKRTIFNSFSYMSICSCFSCFKTSEDSLKKFLKISRKISFPPIELILISAILPPCQSNERRNAPSTAKMFIENLVR